jgi:phosphoglycerate kinase
MNKKTLKDLDVKGKRVIHHCDFNIKLKDNGKGELVPISDVRIKAYFPSIFYLLNHGAKIIFISYLERPGGKVVENLRIAPVAKRMSQLINRQVYYIDKTVGSEVEKRISQMQAGEMLMLENTRFNPGEEADDEQFAQALASLGDLMVEDAFGHIHRVHASTTGIPRHIPSVAGFYLKSEITTFDKLMSNPGKPLVLVIGGTKTFDKVKAIKNLINKTDYVLVGGAVANNFLKARGVKMGSSFLEEPFVDKAKGEKFDLVQMAKELMDKYPEKIILPVDLQAADSIQNPKENKVVQIEGNNLPDNWAYLDIGPKTINKFKNYLKKARTIFWDGPLGKYEDPLFRNGTLKIAEAISANRPATTILAGGDTAAIAEDFGLIFTYDHVSVAGGAALEYLSGNKLPGIEALLDK